MNENNETNTNPLREQPEQPAPPAGGSEPESPVRERKVSTSKRVMRAVFDYAETFAYALLTMMILFLFVFRLVTVDGISMLETLHDGDRLIVSGMFYTPKTGDIVVIQPDSHRLSDEPIIKRVIAVGGQTVRIDYEKWEVYVDGVKLDEPYIEPMRQRYWANSGMLTGALKYRVEFVVAEGKVFCMGDNRNNSKDSRSAEYGEMSANRILGRVVFRISPDTGAVD